MTAGLATNLSYHCHNTNNNNDDDSQTSTTMEEDILLDEIITAFTAQELQGAANASYEYLVQPDPTKIELSAKRLALRFLRAKDGDSHKALQRLKETLQFRREMDVDGLCLAFAAASDGRGNLTYTKRLEQELQSKNLYVQGYDKNGRSTYIFIPRNVQSHDPEWTIKQHVYTLERAIAATKASDRTVNAMVDFRGFSLRHAPPTAVGRKFMETFRNHYAGAIHRIYLIDAPTIFHAIWTMFAPMISAKTRSKIHFVTSASSTGSGRNGLLSQDYDVDQVASWMMATGEKNRDLDVHEYLYETPFHCTFNE